MKNHKLKFLLATIILIFIPLTVVNAKSFVVHLYYDNNTKVLRFDKLKSEEVLLDKKLFTSQVDFLQEILGVKDGKYTAILNNTYASEIGRMQFNPPNSAFDIALPFFPLSGNIKIIDNQTKREVLSSDLKKFLSCNTNNICELEKNESISDCLVDCGTSKTIYSEETQQKLRENNGTIKDPDTGEILLQDKSFSAPTPTPNTSGSNSFFGKGTGSSSSSTAQSSANSTAQSTVQTSKIIYYILAALLVAIAIFGGFVVIKRMRK